MKIKESVGLHFFELSYLAVLAVLPFVVAQQYIGKFLLLTGILTGLYYIIRKALYKAINISEQGVLITGCDTGFGNGLAMRLDALGFTVFATCLNSDGDGAQNLKNSKTGRMHVISMDVTSDDSVKKVLQYVEKTVASKNIDLWAVVNNAGVNFLGDVDLCTMEMYHRIGEINMFGTVRVTKAFLPLIRKSKGRVVNVSSVRGRCIFPTASVYCMAKYGCEAFSDALRLEMLKFGVKVVLVEPGNFGGATGMLNEKALAVMRRDFDTMWEEASDDVKEVYGKEYLDDLYQGAISTSSTTYPTLGPVLDALEDAIINVRPRYRYLVGGGKTFYDIYCVLARLNSVLPESWMDFLISKILSGGLPPIKAQRKKTQ